MSRERAYVNRAAGTDYVPGQMEEDEFWGGAPEPAPHPPRRARPQVWGNVVSYPGAASAPLPRAQRAPGRAAKRVLLLASAVMVVAFLFAQIWKLSVITGQSKQIALLRREITELSNRQESLQVQLNCAADISRVRDEAISRLNMQTPTDGQIRVVTLPEYSSSLPTRNADSSLADDSVEAGR